MADDDVLKVAARVAVLTRAASDCITLARAARASGAEPIVLPCIATQTLPLDAAHLAAFAALPGYAAVAFASRAGVAALAALLARAQATLAPSLACYAVGPATAAAVQVSFGRAARAPNADFDAQGLATLLVRKLPRAACAVLLPAAREGRDELARLLREAGHLPRRLAVYATVPASPARPRRTWDARLHAVVLASPSAVTGFFAQAELPPSVRFVCIGPTTSAAVRARGAAVYAEAHPHDARGLCAALTFALESP